MAEIKAQEPKKRPYRRPSDEQRTSSNFPALLKQTITESSTNPYTLGAILNQDSGVGKDTVYRMQRGKAWPDAATLNLMIANIPGITWEKRKALIVARFPTLKSEDIGSLSDAQRVEYVKLMLSDLRQIAGLSTEEMGEKLGLDDSTYRRLESTGDIKFLGIERAKRILKLVPLLPAYKRIAPYWEELFIKAAEVQISYKKLPVIVSYPPLDWPTFEKDPNLDVLDLGKLALREEQDRMGTWLKALRQRREMQLGRSFVEEELKGAGIDPVIYLAWESGRQPWDRVMSPAAVQKYTDMLNGIQELFSLDPTECKRFEWMVSWNNSWAKRSAAVSWEDVIASEEIRKFEQAMKHYKTPDPLAGSNVVLDLTQDPQTLGALTPARVPKSDDTHHPPPPHVTSKPSTAATVIESPHRVPARRVVMERP